MTSGRPAFPKTILSITPSIAGWILLSTFLLRVLATSEDIPLQFPGPGHARVCQVSLLGQNALNLTLEYKD